MPAEKSHIFVAYARSDADRVRSLLDALEAALASSMLPLDLWIDILSLTPGENWDLAISNALQSSIGFLWLGSSISAHSPIINQELSFFSRRQDALIIPVLLDKDLSRPLPISNLQCFDLSAGMSPENVTTVALAIARLAGLYLKSSQLAGLPTKPEEIPELAAAIADQLRTPAGALEPQEQETAIFVVHGHDTHGVEKLEAYLSSVGVRAVVLSRLDESPQSLFQKFMSIATKARFAIVLLGADDYGASRRQYEAPNVAERALQFRARQNVILELGFFYGRLGFENVFVVYQHPNQVFPNFERPSDLDGVVFDSISDLAWEKKLGGRLSSAGFKLAPPI
jgi:predicted nucleotide-binding protein